MKKKVLHIGFDLDGVLLYNPVRITRSLIAFFKKKALKKKNIRFYFPKSDLEKKIWILFHRSSLFINPGLKNIERLIEQKKIKAYIITSRYSFLKADLEQWLKKIKAKKYFVKSYYNEKNEQPHFFKEKMIKKLKLDIFVEDNWDIVQHLKSKTKKNKLDTKVFWIYNLFDRRIKYKYKFPNLNGVNQYLEKLTKK